MSDTQWKKLELMSISEKNLTVKLIALSVLAQDDGDVFPMLAAFHNN